MYCVHCGAQVADGNRFCLSCGNSFEDQELLRLFVGKKKAEFYFKRWRKNKKVSWNWPAFLFAWFWLGYRKLYSHLFILLGIFIIIDMISYYLGNKNDTIGVSFAIVYGLFGNYFYRVHAEQKIKKIKRLHSNEIEIQEEIIRHGGSSRLGILFAIGLLFIYVLVSAFIYTWLKSL